MEILEDNVSSNEVACNHCGSTFNEANNYCPSCRAPTPAQQIKDLDVVKKKFIYFVVGIAIFCAIMILWLPREIN
jgi:predicted amidophosphoribosyltransferase